MKKLPELNIDLQPLFDLQFGSIKAQVLMSAIDLKIFDHTVKPLLSAEVASAAGTHPGNTEFFLNALVSIDLLKKKNGKFFNTEIADNFLVDGKETYLGVYLQMNEQFSFHTGEQMKEAVMNGPQAPQENSQMDGDFFAVYIQAMRKIAVSGLSQNAASALSKLPEFDGFRKMLDLGGAHGLDCIATVQKHPSMTGIVFDMPPVVEQSKAIISEYGMEERVSVMGGDYTKDSIGSDYDLIYAKGTLNFAGPALGQIVEKIYDALNPGGVFVSIHEGLTEERTKPEGIVISWLKNALTAVDVSLEVDVVPNAMKAAGFTEIEVLPYDFAMGGRLDIVVGRKK